MHYFIIIDYRGASQDKLSFLSTFIHSMTHCIPYYRSDLPFINETRSIAFKQ